VAAIPAVLDGPARLRGQLGRFAVVGGVSTIVHLGLFAVLDQAGDVAGLAGQLANLIALTVATIVNTALNRSWTFGVRGPGALRQHAAAFAVFLLTWAGTAGGLGLLHTLRPGASTWLSVAALALGTGVSTVVRFVAMRQWIFARR